MSERLALGTVQFGFNYGVANQTGQVAFDDARAIIDFARKNHINTLDTAFSYGNSEQVLGKIGVSDFSVISKLPSVPDDCDDVIQWLEQIMKQSLSRLKIDSMHGLLLHKPQQLLGKFGNDLYRGLQALKSAGQVRKIGVSIYDPIEFDNISDCFEMDIVQAPFNIVDRRILASGWHSKLLQQGIELHVRSIFLQGLLLMPTGQRPEKFDRWSSLWSEWDNWLKDNNLTALQACLRYVLSFRDIDKVVVGVDSLQQLDEIICASWDSLPELPTSLLCSEIDLVNPTRWASL